jgi:hypothetical protein
MPRPRTEEPERFPGGADALQDQERYGEIPDGPMGVDLPPDKHPDMREAPEGVHEPDEKSQEPTPEEQRAEEPETPV